jgi:glycosyltransferase involved in cell wall biosynthesis
LDHGLVSVVIPTYDRAQRVVRVIDSVLAQAYRKIEVIVVDDGSSGATATLIRSLFGTSNAVP